MALLQLKCPTNFCGADASTTSDHRYRMQQGLGTETRAQTYPCLALRNDRAVTTALFTRNGEWFIALSVGFVMK